jgi:hypothetical protein
LGAVVDCFFYAAGFIPVSPMMCISNSSCLEHSVTLLVCADGHSQTLVRLFVFDNI